MMDYQAIMSMLLCKAIRDRQYNGNGKLVTDWLSGVKLVGNNINFHKVVLEVVRAGYTIIQCH